MASLDAARVHTAASPLAGGKAGKGIFAARDFGAAEVLFTIADPLVAILDSNSLGSCCYECFRQDQPGRAPLKACLGCKAVYFCNQTCQRKSWTRVHKHECKWLKEYHPRVPPTVSRAAAQILLRRQHGLLPDADFDSVLAMRDHKAESLQLRGQQMAEDYAVISNGIKHIARLAAPVEQISELFYKITVNAQSTTNEDFAPNGICLDPRYASLNHSCNPSAFASFNGRELSVISFRPIKKDDEILVSYVDWTSPYSVRQQKLEMHYFFTCRCEKCQLGPRHPLEKFLCIKCGKPEAVLVSRRLECSSCKHSNSKIPSDLEDLEIEASSEAETLGKVEPAESGPKFLALGKRLLETKVWPLHRQPFPAIIRGLESHYMETDPTAALCFTLANSFVTSPVLYPERWSPLRLQAHHHTLIVLTSLEKDDLSPYLGSKFGSETRVAELTTYLYQVCAEDEEKASAPGATRIQLARQLLDRAMKDAPEGFELEWSDEMWRLLKENVEKDVIKRLNS